MNRLAATAAGSLLVAYVTAAFITASLDPSDWGPSGRASMCLGAAFLWFFSFTAQSLFDLVRAEW